MSDSVLANALYELLNTRGISPVELKLTFKPEDTLIRNNVIPSCCFLVTEGTIGVTSAGDTLPDQDLIAASSKKGERSFAIIGAYAFFAHRPSRLEYFAMTSGTAYVLNTALLAQKFNSGQSSHIIQALLKRSDISSELTTAWENLGKPQGKSFEVFASERLLALVRRRIVASDDQSVICMPRDI